MSEEKSGEKAKEDTLLVKAIAGVFLTVLAPVLVAFGVKYSDAIVAKLTAKDEPPPAAPAPAAPAAAKDPSPATNKDHSSATDPAGNASAGEAKSGPLAGAKSIAEQASASRGPIGNSEAANVSTGAARSGGGGLGPRNKERAAPQNVGPVVRLFNLKSLAGWYTYLDLAKTSATSPARNKDPDGVFTVQNGMIRISGEYYWGTLTTEKEYENYHLTVEYKWGTKTWGDAEKSARTSGVLLHCIGPDGAHLGWAPQAIRCFILEGGTGGLLCYNNATLPKNVSITVPALATVSGQGKARRTTLIYQPGAPLTPLDQGTVRRLGNGDDWKSVIGFYRPGDVEKPTGEWNTLECICQGDEIAVLLNGTLVNEAFEVKPTRGKIGLQSYGAEIFFRKVELQPIAPK